MDLATALADVVGPQHVLTDPELTARYEADWTGRFHGRAAVVVRPGDVQQVVGVMRACAGRNAAVVPQGGNTGLVGGGVPRAGEVVVSLARLTTIGAVDRALGQVTVGAGVTLAGLQETAAAAQQDAAMDFAARDSCTIGGLVACDAGGSRALRYGTARSRVVGLEAVLADGTRLSRLGGLAKDNAGLDVSRLLVGSEGTLGIVTAVRWKLEPRLPARVAVLFGVPGADAGARALAALRTAVSSLEACDFFTDLGLDLVLAHQRREHPLARRWPIYLLVEGAGRAGADGRILEELAGALHAADCKDAVVADDTASRSSLWALREGLPDAVGAEGIPHKLDVGVPLAALGSFLDTVQGVVGEAVSGARTVLWGHLADGNVHVNVLGPSPGDERADDAVLELALACGGTISAEHGVGVAKARWLTRARGAPEVAVMRAVKAALDPDGRMNPGVVLETPRGSS
ncbi:MAG: FAD-binding oxidoreductase [Solirubrobacteraceae bacterium]